MIKNVLEWILSILFPQRCLSCLSYISSQNTLCPSCVSHIVLRNDFVCASCGKRVPFSYERPICHKDSFLLFSATDYGIQQSRDLIHALKYKHIISAASYISFCIELAVRRSGFKIPAHFVAIPIPTSPEKKRSRGYNQAEYITRLFMERNQQKIDIRVKTLFKKSGIKSQIDCADYKERINNIHNGFYIKNANEIYGKTILLFDDVFTSGSTMKEAVKTLRRAGAQRVIGIVFAKA